MMDLVAFVEHYRSGFSESVGPATEVEIESLECLAGLLPGAYLRFLRTLGGKLNPLQLPDLDLSIEKASLAHLSRSHLKTERYLFISSFRGADVDYWMDRQTPVGLDDCLLVSSARAVEPQPFLSYEPLAASLEDFVYMKVFETQVVPSFEHSQWGYLPEYHGPDEVDLALLVPLTLGFTRRARPLHNAIFERDGAAIAIRRDPDGFVGIYLATHDKDELDALAAAFSDSSGYGTGLRRG